MIFWKKGVLYVVFTGVLALPILMKENSGNRASAESGTLSGNAASPTFSMSQFGFHLHDHAEESGVNFIHETPELDPRLDHILPQIASMGASVSVVDFDRDGWNDFYLTNSASGSKNALYHNQQDGTFINIAARAGLDDVNQKGTGVSMGGVWGDYNNDGYEDLFLYKWGRPVLFRNESGEKFLPVDPEKTGFPEWMNANTAIWFDYDADGLLDLFIGGYYDEKIDLWKLETTRIMPESFEYANNGGRNYLFHNLGEGRFEDVTKQAGLTGTRWTLAAGAVDLAGNGYPDLVIANDYGVDEVFLNQQGKGFIHAGEKSGLGFAPKSGMNVSFGDILNSGDLGIYITNITQEGILLQGNNFWTRTEEGNRLTFSNTARQRGIEFGGWSYGAQFGDLNNDGAQDLYVANGFISAKKGTTYWYDYSKVTGGNKSIISDAKNWPDMKGRSQSGYQRNKVWLNDGSGFFLEAADIAGDIHTLDSRAVALADLWNDGSLDVLVANQKNRFMIYRNEVDPANNWISFELEGVNSNKSAIGAVIILHWEDKVQKQVVTGGIGFCSQNQRRLHFGLGASPGVDKAVIHWPSGKEQVIEQPETNKIHRIREAS